MVLRENIRVVWEEDPDADTKTATATLGAFAQRTVSNASLDSLGTYLEDKIEGELKDSIMNVLYQDIRVLVQNLRYDFREKFNPQERPYLHPEIEESFMRLLVMLGGKVTDTIDVEASPETP